jgi:hypothetical protein
MTMDPSLLACSATGAHLFDPGRDANLAGVALGFHA